MKSGWLLSLAVTTLFAPLSSAAPSCKCLSFQPCWPSSSSFSQLASQLSQPLINPIPPASACYPPFNPSSGSCLAVQSHLHDDAWRTNLPGAMISINFESYTFENGTIDACYYNVLSGVLCHQGSIPVIGVDARSVSDIQAAVNFAAKGYLRLVVKNTGHDYSGRSAARGAFMLWTHNLKDITYEDAFIPSGAPPNSQSYKALTLGAGVQWVEAYRAADEHGRTIVGGACPSVGAAGGWVQGGGHSVLSPSYGLGVDNAIQFTVVLASGEYVTANDYQNQDLFWALRGGGGGTFGVVVSVTYRTHDILPVTTHSVQVTFLTPTIAENVTTELFSALPTLQDAHWGGGFILTKAGVNGLYFSQNDSPAQATWSSFVTRAIAAGGVVVTHDQNYPSFYQGYLAAYSSENILGGVPTEIVSRFLSRTIAEQQPGQVATVALGLAHPFIFMSAGGGAVSQVDPDSVAVHPAWRQSLGVMESVISWVEGTSTAAINDERKVAAADLQSLDTVSLNSGTYLNEASLYEPNFQQAFFGSHYPRLKAIKGTYDPNDLFIVAKGVGSEDWDHTLNCRVGNSS
ncbi:hypothetical protein JOM56_011959 [Amanita muscaria]